jgi:hypothetical protein
MRKGILSRISQNYIIANKTIYKAEIGNIK